MFLYMYCAKIFNTLYIANVIYVQYSTHTINVSNVLDFANKHGKSQAPEWLYQLTKKYHL